ncbi:hypothetical protein DPMN_182393 [Dreissena polymorpha]|uniref:Uncharacterized protein n=1 Tax=Dreissena polymorpha TaxID=45954 RepID=A0A9D4I642_DREPO|nr:hypothetical protein DPMN_182393 [Dreissena polymorpha]
MDLFGFGNKHHVVAAIGLGESRFRYGYVYLTTIADLATSFRGNHVQEDRGPSIVLLTSDRKFHSLGRDAETFYRSLADEVKKHYFFIKNITEITEHHEHIFIVKDTEGRQHDLEKIFRDVFMHFRELIDD